MAVERARIELEGPWVGPTIIAPGRAALARSEEPGRFVVLESDSLDIVVDVEAPAPSILNRPRRLGELTLVAGRDGDIVAFRDDGTPAWTSNFPPPIRALEIASNVAVVVADVDDVWTLTPDGQATQRYDGPGEIVLSVAVDDVANVVVLRADRNLIWLNAEGELVDDRTLDGFSAKAALIESELYIGQSESIYRIDGPTSVAEEIFILSGAGGIASIQGLDNGRLVATGGNGAVATFEPDGSDPTTFPLVHGPITLLEDNVLLRINGPIQRLESSSFEEIGSTIRSTGAALMDERTLLVVGEDDVVTVELPEP